VSVIQINTVHKTLERSFGTVAEGDSPFRESAPFRHPRIHTENKAKEVFFVKDDGTEERVGILILERLPLVDGPQTRIRLFSGEIGSGLQIATFSFCTEGNDIFPEIPLNKNSKLSERSFGKVLFDHLSRLIERFDVDEVDGLYAPA
jgi:hypothetical protein